MTLDKSRSGPQSATTVCSIQNDLVDSIVFSSKLLPDMVLGLGEVI